MPLRTALAILVAATAPAVGAAQTLIVPLELDDGNPIAAASIGGVKLRAIIDTGGWRSVGITTAALGKLHVHFTGTSSTRTDESGEHIPGRDFRIPALELGGATFANLPGYEIREEAGRELAATPEFDAIIGRDFLARYTVVVDYPRHWLELHPPEHARAVCGPPTIGMLPSEDGIMFSTVHTDAGVMNLGWDTGATYSVVQKAVANLRGLPLKDDFYSTRRFQLEHTEGGEMDFVSMDMSGVPDLDGLIGYNFFERHRVCFDYRHQSVSVQPRQPSK
jgi:Aspartyl protease